MSFFKRIISFFNIKFKKENKTKKITESVDNKLKESKTSFINSLNNNVVKNKKPKVETLTCVGDGLGIQNKINY